ncbi:hypothetical protein SPBR_01075 [Sporothrix brasiliensis 5110]|uniref:Uncharacterized protein n=1 Tax=Sporothrix brasiliensis 5110 TaxID=1398154 RepID=A0A0C2ETM5_9PEZI|nr:uncharacterized protein SPBR_01075 [Sporothrix brasiliensis 5110]KIH89874.1 hypothetical protein SPBR_01075 [Sporothrix brasiliensis 5110]
MADTLYYTPADLHAYRLREERRKRLEASQAPPPTQTGEAIQPIDRLVADGSCARCPTDFSVRASDAGLEITVWQDFGPEAPVTDMWWQSHIPGPVLQSEAARGEAQPVAPNTWQSGPTIEHDPGSVRVMFETGDAVDGLWGERRTEGTDEAGGDGTIARQTEFGSL